MDDNQGALQPKEQGAIVPRISGENKRPAGLDNVEKEDLKIARLSILQGLSELVSDQKATMGQLANSLTKEVFGDSVEFIPLFFFKTRAQFEVGKGLVMLSRDNITVTMGLDEFQQYEGKPVEEVPGAAWSGKTPPTFGLVYNFPVLLVGRLNEFPLSLSLMKTAIPAAKDLISQATYSGEDMFARVYKLSTTVEKGEKGTYAVPKIEFSRRCTDEEYAVAQACYNHWYRMRKDIAVDLNEEETA